MLVLKVYSYVGELCKNWINSKSGTSRSRLGWVHLRLSHFRSGLNWSSQQGYELFGLIQVLDFVQLWFRIIRMFESKSIGRIPG